MTEFKPEYLAKEAGRLMADTVLNHALALMARDTLEQMARMDVEDTTGILRLQQRYAVIEEFLTSLEGFIMALPDAQDETGSPFA